MAQHDYDLANGTGAAFRSDVNAALAAIVTNNSGASEPTAKSAYQFWADTTNGLLKQRNAANSAWITLGSLGVANMGLVPAAGGMQANALGSAAAPSYSFFGDTNTGWFSPGGDIVALSINGSERARWSATGYLKMSGASGALTTALTDPSHEINSAAASNESLRISSTNASFASNTLSLIASRNTTNNSFRAIDYYNIGGANSRFVVFDSGAILSIGSYNNTTASAANVFIDAAGNFQRSTSSGDYKTDVQPIASEAVDIALQLQPIRYRSLVDADNPSWSWYGLIAEDVAALDPRLVHWGYRDEDYEVITTEEQRYNKETEEIEVVEVGHRQLKDGVQKRPEGVQYERVGVLTLALVQRQEQRIAALEAKVEQLMGAG